MANGAFTFALALLLLAAASPVAAQCMLCAPGTPQEAPGDQPLTIEVEATLDFSRIGLVAPGASGTAIVDPETGTRELRGGLVEMGGMPLNGTAIVRGQPNRRVIVDLPDNVTMTGSDGETLSLSNLRTTLRNNPRLGPDGRLEFSFGGWLQVAPGADGEYRGRIPITVDYR